MTPQSSNTLATTGVGQTVRLVNIDAGKRLIHRLTELGLTPGVELTVLHDAGGSMLVAVRGSRVALGYKMTNRLYVAPMA